MVIIKKVKKFFSGFTLVEIMVIFSILGVITVFAAVNGPTQLQKARDAIRKSNIDRIKKAVEEYYDDKNCYPQTIPSCNNSLTSGNLNLLYDIPCDPTTKLSYTYVPEISDCPSWYQLYGNLEYKTDKIIEKIGCSQGCGPNCVFNYGVSSSNQKLNPFCQEETFDPSSTPEPSQSIDQYVCSPGGACEIYVDPIISGCPDVYIDDPTCQGADTCKDHDNRCKNASGKIN